MRLWLDDQMNDPDTPNRHLPSGYDCGCIRAREAINFINMGIVSHISFDHDLGDESQNGNGYLVAKVIEEAAANGLPRITWDIHSANPVGRKNIEAAMQSAERFWKKSSNQ